MTEKPTYEELEQRVRVLEQAESTFKRTKQGLDDSELWFRSILETINEGVILQAASGEILAWNKRAEYYFRFADIQSDNEKRSDRNLPLIHEDGSKCENKDHPFSKTLQTKKPCIDQIMGVYRTPDDLRWISINTNPLFRKKEEKPYAVIFSFTDVTELKVEKDISQNYLDIAGVIILALDQDGNITLINRKGCEILGGSEHDILGKNWFDEFTPKDQLERVKNIYRGLIKGRIEPHHYSEIKVINMAGIEKIIAWHHTIVKDKDGKITGSLSSGEDITAKKKAEDNLKESERHYRSIIQTTMDGFHLLDMQDNILEVNDAYCKMSGYSRQELLKMKLTDLEAIESKDEIDYGKKIAMDKMDRRFTSMHRRKNGSLFDVEISVRYLSEEEKFVCFIRDITAHRQAEKKQESLQSQLSTAIEIASLGPWEYDVVGDVFTFNDYFYKIYQTTAEEAGGYEMTSYEYAERFLHPEDMHLVAEEIRKSIESNDRNFSGQIEHRIIFPDNTIGYMNVRFFIIKDDKGKTIKTIGVNQDITERKKAEQRIREGEEKLIRSKKMESLGLLAGGVAHDLNNVLSGIIGYPELLLMTLPENSKYRKSIQTIHDSGLRAVAIVQDLLTIARGVATPKEGLNINDIIKEYKNSPEYKKLMQYHPNVAVKMDLSKDLMGINGSSIHIRKVIMNLVSNASEAIEGSGNVSVSTMNRYVDRPVKGYEEVKTGEYAVLKVSDDGGGIPPEHLEKVFEPFFTKKVLGKSGTGLGLAVVWNIVQDHDGYIDVTSDENGTTFELYFPINRDKVSVKDLPLTINDYKGNGESVLVVDDEKTQREINSQMLEALGYKAEAMASGEAAVEYLQDHSVDIILLDMIMNPGIGGRETYEQIIKIHPKQKAVIVSGYAETSEVKEVQRLGAGKYIKKPLTLQKLGPAIKEELSKS